MGDFLLPPRRLFSTDRGEKERENEKNAVNRRRRWGEGKENDG